MKKSLKMFFLAFLSFALFTACDKEDDDPIVEATWQIEIVDNTGSPLSYNKLATDLSGGNHIAYVDEGTDDVVKLKYAYKALNGTWQTEFIENVEECQNWIDMALDTIANKIYVVYVIDNKPVGTGIDSWLMLAEKSIGGTSWTKTPIQSELNNSRYPRITIDKNSGIHVSYSRGGVGDQYYAYRPLNGTFSISLITEDGDANSSIAVDNNLNVHIAYYQSDALRYATKSATATEWTITDIKTDIDYGSSTTASLSLFLNAENKPNVLFFNDLGDDTQCVGLANFSTSWNTSIFSAIEKANVNSLNVFHKSNFDYITYQENIGLSGQHFDLRLVYNSSGTWKTEIVDGNSDNRAGSFNSVSVENNGRVNIAYSATNEGVLKFATSNKLND